MSSGLRCMPFPLYWKEERMSLAVKILRNVGFSDHEKEIGVARVILARNDKAKFPLATNYVTELLDKDIMWYEDHEGFEVKDEDLLKACEEVAEKIWDE